MPSLEDICGTFSLRPLKKQDERSFWPLTQFIKLNLYVKGSESWSKDNLFVLEARQSWKNDTEKDIGLMSVAKTNKRSKSLNSKWQKPTKITRYNKTKRISKYPFWYPKEPLNFPKRLSCFIVSFTRAKLSKSTKSLKTHLRKFSYICQNCNPSLKIKTSNQPQSSVVGNEASKDAG